ncbi:peptidoglycan-binding domain-containing protein [Pararoseomonas sp. SCSIO 73927]|uniref:peptidoglycan-binding domain-containing protein n=1 Tax=Pararoseomonas sp. SCSIO 73927 TaxID=3114537 RepID=UPI0030CF4EB8
MTHQPRSLPAAALVAFAAACSPALAQGPSRGAIGAPVGVASQAAPQEAPPGTATDCAPSPTPGTVAAALCADPAARAADRRRALAYEALRHQLHPSQRPGLEADARNFQAFLETGCRPGGTPDPACIARATAAKRDDLLRWLQPPAREEAERDPDAAAALESRLPAALEARREAIAALQRRAGLPPTGLLDSRTAALVPRPATPSAQALPTNGAPTAPPAGTVWLPRFPFALNARYAVQDCGGPAVTWYGGGLHLGGRAVPGETNYAIFADEQRFYLFPATGGPARILEGQPDGGMRLSGAIPAALAGRGITPGIVLRRCAEEPVRIGPAPRPARRR